MWLHALGTPPDLAPQRGLPTFDLRSGRPEVAEGRVGNPARWQVNTSFYRTATRTRKANPGWRGVENEGREKPSPGARRHANDTGHQTTDEPRRRTKETDAEANAERNDADGRRTKRTPNDFSLCNTTQRSGCYRGDRVPLDTGPTGSPGKAEALPYQCGGRPEPSRDRTPEAAPVPI